jgi:hypothetical protein
VTAQKHAQEVRWLLDIRQFRRVGGRILVALFNGKVFILCPYKAPRSLRSRAVTTG